MNREPIPGQDTPGPIIEPDTDGKYRPMPRVFLWAGLALVFVWIGFLVNHTPDWYSLAVGALTAGMLVAAIHSIDDGTAVEHFKPRKRVHQWPPKNWFQ